MLKQWTKNFIRSTIGRLPWGLREATLEGLLRREGEGVVLERLAKRAGITTFGTEGQYGRFVSAPNDRSVLWKYAAARKYAEVTNQFFISFLANGGTYLDIGANIGMTTVPIARNARVQCISFEPDPVNFANLSENVSRNNVHGNVTLHQIALFNRRTTVDFSLSDQGNLGDHRIWSGTGNQKVIQVPAAPLDELVPALSGPLAAKIDVQGAEPFVVAGGRSTLEHVHALSIEFSPYHMRQLKADGNIVLDYLSGFSQVAVTKGESEDTPVFGPAIPAIEMLRALLIKNAHDEAGYMDVYAMRGPGYAVGA